MNGEMIAALIALVWLLLSTTVVIISVRRGRRVAAMLEAYDSSLYRQLGRPRPGYFPGDRSMCFTRYLSRREYLSLGDKALVREFENFQRFQGWMLALLLSTLLMVAIVVYLARRG